jgi:hypothetical protein
MKADILTHEVKHVSIVAALGMEEGQEKQWHVYLLNENDQTIEQVLIRSLGYGEKEGLPIQTSTLRHFIGDVEANEYARIEPIDEQVFGLSNEYWVSYRLNGQLYDKKYIFQPNSIQLENSAPIPMLGVQGIRLD